jgi:hypothetical protein
LDADCKGKRKQVTQPLGFFIPDHLWDALVDLHAIGKERGDSDEEIAAACFELLEVNGADRAWMH